MRHLVPESALTTTRDRASLPPPLNSADPASFAHSVLHHRHPLLIEQARAAHPYGPRQHDALDRLAAEATGGVVQPLDPAAHDASAWQGWGLGRVGQSWDAVPFLWSECYFYRRLLGAVDFFTPGPWYWLDLFAHQKDAELADPAVEVELAALEDLATLTAHERGTALLLSALWGNRADLGFAAHADVTISENLVVDDSAQLWCSLAEGAALCAWWPIMRVGNFWPI